MVSGAKTEITIGRQFKKDRIDIQRLKTSLRGQRSPGSSVPPRFGTGPSGARLDPIQRLATQGDSMIGPIAFFPQAVTIATGVIDIGIQTEDYSTRIIVLGEGSVADVLDTILNARFAGQFLVLQAVATTPITLKHLTGNIRIPSGNDYIIKGLESVILFFDSTSNEWVLVAGDSGLTNPMTEDFDMAGFNINNLDIINWEDGDVEESVATGIKWTLALNHAIEIQNSSLQRMVLIDSQADSFDISSLLRMVGSVEQTTITQLDGVDAAFQIEMSGPQWLFKIAGTNVFQIVEEVATTEYAFNPLVTGDGGFKYFFESGTYFTGSGTSGRINVYNDGVNRYFFTNNEFAIFDENLLLTGSVNGGYIQIREAAGDPGGLADNFRFYGKDDGGVTKAFVQWSDGTVKELGGGPPFDDNQDIIQDNVTNSKKWRMTLDAISALATKTFSFVGGGSATYTFQSSGGLMASIDLAQTWSAVQTINADFISGNQSDLGNSSNQFGDVFLTGSLRLGGLTTLRIVGDAGGIDYHVPATRTHDFKINLSVALRIDSSLRLDMFNHDIIRVGDIELGDGDVVRATGANEIGFFVTNQSSAVGAAGSIQIPVITTVGPSDATLDTQFGAFNGAIGLSGANEANPKLQVRSNGNWSHVFLSNSN